MSPDTIKPDVARAAAEWWAQKLREDDPKVDNGDAMQSALGSVNRERALEGVSDEQIDDFEDFLTEMLLHEEIRGKDRYIKCDYGPHPMLAEAAEEVGIENVRSAFPWKTGMWIETDRVLVSEGYHSDREEIYSTDEWPPETDAILADLEISFTTSKSGAEAYGPLHMIEGSIKEFNGYELTRRHLTDVSLTQKEVVEKHNNPAYRVDASITGALVFATEEYYESRRYHEYGDTPDEIARAAFEVMEHLDLEVHTVVAEDLGTVTPTDPVDSILPDD